MYCVDRSSTLEKFGPVFKQAEISVEHVSFLFDTLHAAATTTKGRCRKQDEGFMSCWGGKYKNKSLYPELQRQVTKCMELTRDTFPLDDPALTIFHAHPLQEFDQFVSSQYVRITDRPLNQHCDWFDTTLTLLLLVGQVKFVIANIVVEVNGACAILFNGRVPHGTVRPTDTVHTIDSTQRWCGCACVNHH